MMVEARSPFTFAPLPPCRDGAAVALDVAETAATPTGTGSAGSVAPAGAGCGGGDAAPSHQRLREAPLGDRDILLGDVDTDEVAAE